MRTKTFLSFGIELEGGILHSDKKKIGKYAKNLFSKEMFGKKRGLDIEQKTLVLHQLHEHLIFKNDSSVEVYNNLNGWDRESEICFWHEKLDVLLDFVRYVFSTSFKQNHTCGNHIHIRFFDMEKAISCFSYNQYWTKFLKLYKNTFSNLYKNIFQNEKYLDRLQNRYCIHRYSENTIIDILNYNGNNVDRYRSINLASVVKHNTIEFRILPHFLSKNEAVKSIKKFVEIVRKVIEAKNFTCKRNANIQNSYCIVKDAVINGAKKIDFRNNNVILIDKIRGVENV